MSAVAIFATFAGAHTAFFDFDVYQPRSTYGLWYDVRSPLEQKQSPSPSAYWTSSHDAYQLKLSLPDLEPKTLSASLASDGKSIQIAGERKIEGCRCTPTTVKEVTLPYRPRPDDVDVSVKDGVLSIKLGRQAKDDTATPLKVKVEEAPEQGASDTTATRPLRFVPHESARAEESKSLEEKERSLTDKFRSAALASLASTRSPVGGNDQAATAARGDTAAVDASVASANSSANSANPSSPP